MTRSHTATKLTGVRNATSVRHRTRAPNSPARANHAVLRLQQAVGNQAAIGLLQSGLIQPKLHVGPADDAYEREADRTAQRIMRMPDPYSNEARPLQAPISQVQRMCPECEEEQDEKVRRQARDEDEEISEKEEDEERLQRKAKASGAPPLNAGIESRLASLRGGGRSLPPPVRSFFEPRFNHDFSDVRLHTGSAAGEAARSINARAFTLGPDITFASGEYAPGTPRGQRLLAHELTHVVQQSGGSSRSANSESPTSRAIPTSIQRKWIVNDPDKAVPKRGKKNKTLLLAAFKKICNRSRLVKKGGDTRIELGGGKAKSTRKEGCGCLTIIENDVTALETGKTSVLKKVPTIEVVPHGWSSTLPDVNAPHVGVRHPIDPFRWGYWTGGDQRHIKEFFRTVAHEVCGHMVPLILGIKSGRGSARGHNEAIIRENLIAAEHGVPVKEQRGLDKPEGTITPGKHRGESFLKASLDRFGHASSTPPAGLTEIIESAIGTIKDFIGRGSDRIRIQLEGFAYTNEGGKSLAQTRIDMVKKQFEVQLKKEKIPLTFTPPGSTAAVSRFALDLATVLPGTSKKKKRDRKRRVDVFTFHRAHSAGP